jgi:two-component system, LytTR family, response regulator
MSLKCIIVDDEPNAINLLAVLIEQTTGWQLPARCTNALEAISFLKNNVVDLIFLDINMPMLSGMELAPLLPAETGIVFTTAYSEHAAESYAFNTIDYLLKPITLKRFLACIKKIEIHFEKRVFVPSQEAVGEDKEYFFVKSGTELRKILLNEILFFESRKEYVRVVTKSFEVLTYRRLKDIEAQLSLPFTRVHHSFIVNIRQLYKIQDNQIHIGEATIPIGDKFRDGLMEVIRKRTF